MRIGILLVALGLCVSLVGARPVAAQAIGDPVPELGAGKWYRSPPLTLEQLRGKAVLLVALRTFAAPCETLVPELNARYANESVKGLVIIGITSEDRDVVDAWVARVRPRFPVVALQGAAFETALQISSFPCRVVVGPGGKLAYSDGLGRDGTEKALSAAMDKAKRGPLWPKRLEKVAAFIAADQFDRSYAELGRQLAAGELKPDEKATADRLKAFLESAAVDACVEAQHAFDAGLVCEAHERLRPFAAAKPPFPVTPDCAKLLAQIEALPAYPSEMKAGEQFRAAKELERAQKYADARDALRSLATTFPATKVAAVAEAEAKSLDDRGLPGFRPDCEACKAAGRACEKHADKRR